MNGLEGCEPEDPLDLAGPERRKQAREIQLDDVVLYVAPDLRCNALVTVNFDPEKRCPRLSLVYVRHGKHGHGITTANFIPHQMFREDGETAYWIFPTETER